MERWWAENVRTVEIALKTDAETGLSSEEARTRLEKYGKNEIEEQKKDSPLKIFLRQFQDPLVYILLAAAALSALLGDTIDFFLISIILVFNGVLGFIQEYKAEKALEALKQMTTPRAKVIRNGRISEIPATELVPGDVVVLEEGDVVPADIRLFEANGLTVDESLLTGESVPVVNLTDTLSENTPLADRKNMAYAGTLAVRGHGKGIVVATGMETEMGKIAKHVSESREKKTHLEEELEKLGTFITRAVLGIVIVIAAVLIAYNPSVQGILNALLTSVSLAVAAVPEGLPAVVTITLALGVRQMAKRNAIVRRLKSVETLGSVDVICTDKTGTLTHNKMKVVATYGNEEKMAEIGYFCHSLDENGHGDPTEEAIFQWAKNVGSFDGKKINELPFDSKRKRMTVIVERDGKHYAYMKGAPEIVLSLCSLGPSERKKLAKIAEDMAARGLRVLAMAWKKQKGGDPEDGLTFAGFVGLLDPPREDAITAMKTAMKAGIRVIMITGDHARTAEAIARQMGLDGRIITGEDLERMSDEELEEIIEEVAVFARVSPDHKPRIVEALQRKGHIVAMTGDGVNDAVALKRADIGVAMGSGTEVAKEAADMILLDDSFATIVAAIEEGRRIFNNIKSFVIYLLSANMGEVVAVFFGSVLGYVVLRPAQILWMNLLTDGPPALAISADPAPKDIMKRPPRKRGEGVLTERDKKVRILGFGVVLGLGILGMFLVNAHDLALAQGAALTGFVLLELVRLDVIREVPIWKNKYLLATVLAVVLLQLAVLYTPLSGMLGVKPLTLEDWAEIGGFAAAIYILARVMNV